LQHYAMSYAEMKYTDLTPSMQSSRATQLPSNDFELVFNAAMSQAKARQCRANVTCCTCINQRARTHTPHLQLSTYR